MKPAIVFIITFVVGTAAATGAKVMTTKPAEVHADSTHADSAAKDSAHAAAEGLPTHTVDGPPAHTAVDTASHLAAAANAQPSAANPAAPGAHAAANVGPDSTVQASERRVAKVFTSMDPKQAAKVLEHMADSDVQIILGYVGPRQAAAIMAALPPERVAKLSKLAMNGSHAR